MLVRPQQKHTEIVNVFAKAQPDGSLNRLGDHATIQDDGEVGTRGFVATIGATVRVSRDPTPSLNRLPVDPTLALLSGNRVAQSEVVEIARPIFDLKCPFALVPAGSAGMDDMDFVIDTHTPSLPDPRPQARSRYWEPGCHITMTHCGTSGAVPYAKSQLTTNQPMIALSPAGTTALER
jgi:hypothetical protein